MPRGDFLTHEIVDLRQFRLCVQGGAHRRASGRQLVYHRHVQIAVHRHGQCPRNRCGGHYQHMRRSAVLRPKLRPLLYSESVLFVYYGQSQILPHYIILQQGVRPDYKSYLPVFQPFVNLSSLAAL